MSRSKLLAAVALGVVVAEVVEDALLRVCRRQPLPRATAVADVA